MAACQPNVYLKQKIETNLKEKAKQIIFKIEIQVKSYNILKLFYIYKV